MPKVRPLLAAQLGVWFAFSSADPTGSTFNIGDYIAFDGPVRPDLLESAHDLLIREIEVSLISFVESEDGRPMQVLGRIPNWPLHHVDFSDYPDPVGSALAWMKADMETTVDLLTPPLFNAALLRTSADRHLLYRRAHHILLDGWSLDLLGRRLAEIYSDLSADRVPSPSRFGCLSVLLEEEAAYRNSGRFERDRAFWLAKLAGVSEPTTLAARPAPGPRGTQRVKRDFGLSRFTRLRAAADTLGVTWSELALTITVAYVMRITGAQEITLGLPISGRTTKAQRTVPCMSANVVPLRLRSEWSASWEMLARTVRSEVRAATMHGRYRSEDLARDLGLVGRRQALYGPVVNIMAFDQVLRFADVRAQRRSVQGVGIDDMSFTFWQMSADDLELIVDANPRLYGTAETTGHLVRFFGYLDSALDAAPGSSIADIDLVGPGEREVLLSWATAAHGDLPAELGPELFQQRVTLDPGAPAVEFHGATTSYEELNEASNRLARLLTARGVGPGAIVGLALPRSVELVTAMLATIKAGAAYLPLDLEYPPARLAYMVADAKPEVLLTTSGIGARTDVLEANLVVIDDDTVLQELSACAGGDLRDEERTRSLTPDDPAYVIYTSGSTGSPKGVVVPHSGLGYLQKLAVSCFALDSSARVLQFVSPSFDMSVADVWMTLTNGGTLVLADRQELQPGPEIEQFLAESAVSHVMLPPSTLEVLSPERIQGGTTFVVAGESCTAKVAGDWSSGRQLFNAYGPTETTVYCAVSQVLTPELDGSPPIGRPAPGARLYVLDTAVRLTPVGVSGELYIGGIPLARGYLGRPDLTAARFVPDPFGPAGSRMYRSGDMVRWTPDGQLHFLGRNDDQVKVRGFRIELGEVEQALLRCSGVRRAVAVVREDRPAERRLAAYVVPVGDVRLDPGTLRAQLAEKLPEYMVPLVTVLGELPLTPSGKIDRGALPAPSVGTIGDRVESQTVAEKLLAGLFAYVLGIPTPGANESFFDLGGDSLSAARLLGRMNAVLGARLTMRQLFADPTVVGLARLAESMHSPSNPSNTTS